jgi:long-chain acyl-CoA synthetase
VIIVPDWDVIMELVKTHGIKYKERTELLDHPKILEYFQKEVDRLTPDLASYEKPKKVVLLEQELTIEGGELTPTLKVKRRVVDLKYKDVIDKIYQEK